jgi:hypothetical protein
MDCPTRCNDLWHYHGVTTNTIVHDITVHVTHLLKGPLMAEATIHLALLITCLAPSTAIKGTDIVVIITAGLILLAGIVQPGGRTCRKDEAQ